MFQNLRGAITTVAKGILALISGRSVVFVISGQSMEPTLLEGDWVLIRRTTRVFPGEIVVAERSNSNKLDIVKRMAFSLPIKSSNPDHLFLKGDNESASTDSRDFGPINATDVLGVVWLCYWPLKRIQLFLPADAG